MKKKFESMYLDYFNNFLTVTTFAEWYGITEDQARRIIHIGRSLNQRNPKH